MLLSVRVYLTPMNRRNAKPMLKHLLLKSVLY